MRKFFLVIVIIFGIMLLFFTVDHILVNNKQKPIFVIKTESYDDNSVRYTGLGYHVYHVKSITGLPGPFDYGYHLSFWFTDNIDEVRKKVAKDNLFGNNSILEMKTLVLIN